MSQTTPEKPDFKEIEKLYNELTDPNTLQCNACGVKLNLFFIDFKFCPLCRAPAYKQKEIREFERQLNSRKPKSSIWLPGDD